MTSRETEMLTIQQYRATEKIADAVAGWKPNFEQCCSLLRFGPETVARHRVGFQSSSDVSREQAGR